MRHRSIWIALLAALALCSAPTLALGKGKNKHGKHHHKHRHHKARHAHVHGGPPPWAPAHGYRHVHGVYVAPFGIDVGTCRRDLLAPALGATGGGLLASELSDGDPRAIVGGVILGALFGGALGETMDGVDRGCVGQVLEHAPPRETVAWANPNDTHYAVTPTRTYETEVGRFCREYTTRVTIGGREEVAYGTAYRQPDGSWERP